MLTKVFLYAACTTLVVKAMFTDVKISDEVFDTYDRQIRGYEYDFVRYKITGSRPLTLVVESTGDDEWQDFVDGLPNNEPRIATYRFDVSIGDHIRKGTVFVLWIPNSAGMRQNLIYASIKDDLKANITLIKYEVVAHSKSDLDYYAIYDEVDRRY